jgi:hypothetical protein
MQPSGGALNAMAIFNARIARSRFMRFLTLRLRSASSASSSGWTLGGTQSAAPLIAADVRATAIHAVFAINSHVVGKKFEILGCAWVEVAAHGVVKKAMCHQLDGGLEFTGVCCGNFQTDFLQK